MQIYKFGTSTIPLTYTPEELKRKVEAIVDSMQETFSFDMLCQNLVHEAENESKLQKEPHTEYSSIRLTAKDIRNVSYIIWDMIWKHELFIVFDAYPYDNERKNILLSRTFK